MDAARLDRVARRAFAALSLIAIASCGDTAPDPGSIAVNFSTNPGDENPFVWGVSVDGASPHNINSADTGRFVVEAVSAGDHHLIASSLPASCTTGEDNRPVTVPSKDTLRVTFSLKCARSTGDISAVITTTGFDFDPDGYQLTVNGAIKANVPAVATTSVTVPRVAPGTYQVSLTGLAANCSIQSASQLSATVVPGNVASVLIQVVCASLNGTIHVTTTSTGTNLDPNDYLVSVSGAGSATGNILPNGSVNVSAKAGSYTVTLGEIEPSCGVPASQTVTVAQSQTSNASFAISCGAYPATVVAASATDAPGDTIKQISTPNADFPGKVRAYDILAVNTRYASNFLIVSVKFDRPITDTLVVDGYVDIDENPSTGATANLTAFGGSILPGIDALFESISAVNVAGWFPHIPIDTVYLVKTVFDADSMQIYLPLSRIGDDGNFGMTLLAYPIDRQDPGDMAPNSGFIVTHKPAGLAAMADLFGSRIAGRDISARAIPRLLLRKRLVLRPPPRNHRQ